MPHRSPTPTWNHPLFGADPWTLIRAARRNRPLPGKVRLLVGAMMAASLLRGPASLCERAWTAARLRRLPSPRPPVIILGHWRSGTTHLFNLLSRDPQFAWPDPFSAGIPWDFLLLGRALRPLIRPALPKQRFVDEVAVNPDSPQEDEIGLASMQDVSYYHGIYFPRRFESRYRQGIFLEDVSGGELDRWRRRFEYYHRKLLVGRPDRTLLIKNPVYTGRTALIRETWPEARFVHIYRNPYEVFESTRKFYRALLPRFALQDYDEEIADSLIAETYPRMINILYKDLRNFPPDRFVELRFEDLEERPLAELERLYDSLKLPGFSGLRPEFERYLESVADYTKNQHRFDAESIEQVERHWGDLVRRWGYQPPR